MGDVNKCRSCSLPPFLQSLPSLHYFSGAYRGEGEDIREKVKIWRSGGKE